MEKIMCKLSIVLAGLLLGCAVMAAAHLTISNVTVNPKGQTYATLCANTKGYYFEINKPKQAQNLTVYGFGGKMQLKKVVTDLLFDGWKPKFGKKVNVNQKITWSGHQSWTTWLQKLAFEKNLAIILDWSTKTVYINRL